MSAFLNRWTASEDAATTGQARLRLVAGASWPLFLKDAHFTSVRRKPSSKEDPQFSIPRTTTLKAIHERITLARQTIHLDTV
jgi:hypothetical protein